MNTEQLGGLVRTVVIFVGGFLVNKGVVDGETVATVAGSVATIAMAVWSYVSKKPAKAE